MEKITMQRTTNYPGDTVLTFSKDDVRAEIELCYTDADPDFGTETLVCGGDKNETLLSLCRDQLDELTTFLDETNDGTYRPEEIVSGYKHLEDLNNSSLIAFERMLQEILGEDGKNRSRLTFTNKNGHAVMIAPINEVASIIREHFAANDVQSVYIATAPNYEDEDEKDPDKWSSWFKIIKLDLPFDNTSYELALLMGYCGGGNVELAYGYDDSDTRAFARDIARMISNSTGEDETEIVYAEFIGVNDKHSYENIDR